MINSQNIIPELNADNMDVYIYKKSILNTIDNNTNKFEGRLLDIGGGIKDYKSYLFDNTSIKEYLSCNPDNKFSNNFNINLSNGKLTLETDSIDFVISLDHLEYAENSNILISEIYRVLKPDGYFLNISSGACFNTISENETLLTLSGIKSKCLKFGFEFDNIKPFLNNDSILANSIGQWIKNKTFPEEHRENTINTFFNIYKYLASAATQYSNNNISIQSGYSLLAKKTSTINKSSLYDSISAKTDNEISVSVIVPTYNRPDMLEKAIQSILKQKFQNFEIIVVNDAGKDVGELIDKLNSLGKIRYFKHDKNKGNAGARNTGLKHARGKYIAYLDDDDTYLPNHLDILYHFLEISTLKVAYTDAQRITYKKTGDSYITLGKDFPYSEDFDGDKLLVNNYIPNLCIMHERACIEQSGYFDENLTSHVDWDFLISLSLHFEFKHIKVVTCEFSARDDCSNLTEDRSEMLKTLDIIYNKTTKYVEGNGDVNQARNYFRAWLEKEASKQKTTKETSLSRDQIASAFSELKQTAYKDQIHKYNVNIIIPVFNQYEYTQKCLETLFDKNNEETKFKVTVVDNGSSDLTKEILEDFKENYGNMNVISNPDNHGFARACNQAMKSSDEKYLLLLNNDVIPTTGFLDNMIKYMDRDESIAAAGSLLLYPDNGLIQHAWVTIGNDKGHIAPYHAHRYANPETTPDARKSKNVSAVTGACMLIRNSAAEKVNYLDDKYVNGFEDIDFCLKLKDNGFKITYCSDSVLYHYESITDNRHEHDMKNWLRLKKKWQDKNVFDESVGETSKNLLEIDLRYKTLINSIKHTSEIDYSIIIPAHNNLEFTKSCINGIIKTKGVSKIEIIVINNASDDKTAAYLDSIKDQITIITNNINENYSHINNQGANIAGGKFLVFLNNDTLPFPGWLDAIGKEFSENKNTAAQGVKLLYQNGAIQHAGMVFGARPGRPEEPYHVYLTADPSLPFVNKRRPVQFVTGACLAIRKEIFDEIEGFDEDYVFGWEDTDLCMKINSLGKDIIYNPEAVLYHFESVTKKLNQMQGGDFMDGNSPREHKNRERFFEKWNDYLKRDADMFYAEDGFKLIGNSLQKIESKIIDTSETKIKNIRPRNIKAITSLSSIFRERDYKSAHNVLIKCAAAVGDSLTMTAVVADIKKQYPHLKILISGVDIVNDIFKGHPDIDGFVPYGSEDELMLETLSDIVIDYNNIIAKLPEYYNKMPYMDILGNIAGIKFNNRGIVYYSSEEEIEFANREMAEFKTGGKLIGVQFITSKDIFRSYPFGSAVIDYLLTKDDSLKFMSLGIDEKLRQRSEIYDGGGRATDLRKQIALAQHCDAFLTVDSAFFHVGHNFYHKPTLVIAGITNPKLIGNPAAGFEYIRNENSEFLNSYWQKAGDNDTMTGLAPETVGEKLLTML